MTKWQMNRAGLLSFWYYDDEIFDFADGKLLLRGTNGSGKSVTMQSFIPVLLDGRKSPDRLDPFGTGARKMSDYLLGEEEVAGRDERTGYLFLEYKMAGSEQYITTGVGMQARRYKDLKSWYFVITDNRRIAIDFELAHRNSSELIPFSQKELTNRIGTGGIVTGSQKEYAKLVNKYIFGFETMEAYEDLVKLLIQLRAPKLSKDFKPTVLYEILESALPPITDDDLRQLSSTIESLDQTQQQLEQLTAEYEANKKIVKRYDAYNTYILAERASYVVQTEERLAKITEEKHQQLQKIQASKQLIEKYKREYTQLKTDLISANKEEQSLSKHKVWDITKKLGENKERLQEILQSLTKLEKRKDQQEMKRIKLYTVVKQQRDNFAQKDQQQEQLLTHMASLAQDIDFMPHRLNHDNLLRESVQFTYWKQEVASHKNTLKKIETLILKYDNLRAEDKQLERQSSQLLMQIDNYQKDFEQAEHWYLEEQHKLKTALFIWMTTHEELQFSEVQQQQVARIIEQLYEQTTYREAQNILMTNLTRLRGKLNGLMAENEIQQQKLVELITKEQLQLEKLQAEELAEPSRLPGTKAFRQQLTEQNIPHVPFYAAVEFKQSITDEQQARIEAVLATTGILDSLISPQIFDVREDALLIPNPKILDYTLADFLQPDIAKEGIPSALVDDVLRSIPLEATAGNFTVDETGLYYLGITKGHAPSQGPSKFIGRTARKRYQDEQIELARQAIQQLQENHQILQAEHKQLQQQLAITVDWEDTIPHDTDVYDINVEIRSIQEQQKLKQQQQEAIDQKWQDVRKQVKIVQQALHLEGNTVNIMHTKDKLAEALTSLDRYLEKLNELQRTMEAKQYAKEQITSLEQQLEDIEFTIDDIHDDIIDGQNKQNITEQEIQSQQQQLALEGEVAIKARVEHVQKQKEQLEKHLEELPIKQRQQEVIYETTTLTMQQLEKDEVLSQHIAKQWQLALQEELDLGFVALENKLPKMIVEQFKTPQERSKLQENLTRVMNEEMNALAEYNSSSYLKETALLESFEHIQDDRVEVFKQLRNRRIIELRYRGQRVSPYQIDAFLQKELEDSQYYLDMKDRELYEEVIINSVGTILRQRIARAQQWIKAMDVIMSERDNSSGLIFSVSWRPRTAEAEDELDTKELVQLLQRKSTFLSEVDLKKITQHFRSRIENAKETVSMRNEGSTLRQALKEVLDYRKWFSFVLSYTRPNEKKKELTNNAFYKFSGGEKAMAMYIPLFTAAYSRYKEADPMAPFIISLDEAFAGVDDQNIRDMFEVVEQLGFNYIMNSQVIWGDYSTVTSLAIAELVRPKNADYVTVLHYYWNGKERELIE